MEAKCQNCNSTRFVTTAHVVQTWIVDSNGNFVAEIQTDEVTHGPNADNEWACAKCGCTANVKRLT